MEALRLHCHCGSPPPLLDSTPWCNLCASFRLSEASATAAFSLCVCVSYLPLVSLVLMQVHTCACAHGSARASCMWAHLAHWEINIMVTSPFKNKKIKHRQVTKRLLQASVWSRFDLAALWKRCSKSLSEEISVIVRALWNLLWKPNPWSSWRTQPCSPLW